MRNKLHAKDVLYVGLGFFARAGNFHAAAFATASGVNLGFHHDARSAFGKQCAGHRGSFFRSIGHFAPGNGNSVFCQDFLRLVLVYFHVILRAAQSAVVGGFGARPGKSPGRRDRASGREILSCCTLERQTGGLRSAQLPWLLWVC